MTHTPHPPTLTHGLADGCGRCFEHADHPFESLDNEHLQDLVRRVRTRDDNPPRSNNEARAMRAVATAIHHAAILARLEKES